MMFLIGKKKGMEGEREGEREVDRKESSISLSIKVHSDRMVISLGDYWWLES